MNCPMCGESWDNVRCQTCGWREAPRHYVDDLHVIPENDLRQHFETRKCWCLPSIVQNTGAAAVVTHNSADGRELVERHGTQ